MQYQPYLEQLQHWPSAGQHIMAQYDADSIYVYQAYKPSIAEYAVAHQAFGGDFSFSRMSWIKPNFLWMMFRAGWATKEGQEHILAIRLPRTFFDELLRTAVASSFAASDCATEEEWRAQVTHSDVRLQWDPDHDPTGRPIERRAIQLGLRGRTLERFGREVLLSVEDITPFVAEQREKATGDFQGLIVPAEASYIPGDSSAG
ncbi:DUF4291 domain-containing protein [Ralstonia insidiosa]|jgi:hypothetical protein|uniref:Uncharacterized protein n=1 Tax=Ralstonia insidiosa TaxID=190721 RepID=A0A192A6C7_9RALS|nr:DUF4291 domain-containing protein [Ralstonia insidiosa]ANJ75842.1 hypothetical protein A9Y76_25605 [Ralstonia insidiosa]KAB0469355.1 DUF4291 domain-containing protein [Ralstonia insidiosa]MBY4910033.1 DUF4291 domain-containing protein [Ralstonia insidiosa]